jgi:hypothetical protein
LVVQRKVSNGFECNVWQRRSNARFALTGKGKVTFGTAKALYGTHGKGYAANRKAPLGKEDYLRRMK